MLTEKYFYSFLYKSFGGGIRSILITKLILAPITVFMED